MSGVEPRAFLNAGTIADSGAAPGILAVTGLWLGLLLAACGAHATRARLPQAEPGASQFQSYCAACHLGAGPGMIGEAPPLEGSPWVAGPEDRLIKIVLHGLHGPVDIGGRTYNQEMPGFGQTLTDADIASLLSFVRKRFGGAATPVLPATVRQVRAATSNRTGYWTAAELRQGP